jgi:hypothetical protein
MVFVAGIIMMIGFIGCDLKTPEIRGVVLDAETKKPVEGAWVRATLQIKTKTIQGNVQSVLRVEPPHTRSDKKGTFVIPAKEIKTPSFPMGLGTDVESFTINASTLDDKSDGFYLKDFEGKNKIEAKLNVKPWKEGIENEREYFSYIQSLYKYCFSGRFGVEVPAIEGGCDNWELNFVIAKHERYLERFSIKDETRSHNSIILEELGLLHEKKGNYEKAIENLKKAKQIRFFRPQDLDNEIKRIQEKLQPQKGK